jgi:STE24 endopeptidase
MMTFDPQAATARYIDSLGPQALDKAHHYTVGGHWLLLWGLLVGALVTWLIVRSRLLDRIDARIGERRRALRTFVLSAVYFLVSALLTLPWTIYSGWWRERGYGRSSQPVIDFLGQNLLSTLLTAAFAALFMIGVYALIRRSGRRWWIWSGGLTAAALAFLFIVSPILIEPLFNKYEAVPTGPVRTALIDMAAKANIPADRIFMYNGSRQSNNFTANVSGIGGSARVAISDVALKSASLDEVRAITGHEIGHYVLGHVWYGLIVYSLLAILLFFLADRLFPRFARAFGTDAAIGDPRGVPVLLFIVSLLALLAMPILNTLSRTTEAQADRYSLATENRPDALSSALVKTAEYRYPRPGSVEEIIFYDHPSVERRVRTAMEWKAIHPPSQNRGR